TPVIGGHKFVKIAGGNNHTCALTTEGEAYCWGSTDNTKLGALDEMGSPVTGNSLEPVKVATDQRFVDIDLGQHYTCALSVEGKAWCWGSNTGGKVGTGTTSSGNFSTPSEV